MVYLKALTLKDEIVQTNYDFSCYKLLHRLSGNDFFDEKSLEIIFIRFSTI